MTGFSSTLLTLTKPGTAQQPIHLSLSLKTLNSRYFELNCKMPYSLSFLETDLLKQFKAKLHRGTIQLGIHLSDPTALTGSIKPALSTVHSYVDALTAIKKECNVAGDVTIHDLISLPNIFETIEMPLDKAVTDQILAAINDLVDACVKIRVAEGKALEKDLENRIAAMQKYLDELVPRAKVVMEQKKEQLLATLKTALADTDQPTITDSQVSAISQQLDRIDIHEEIVRFKTHLKSLAAILTSPDIETGKKLDFTLQELFRETNTIASKCSDSQISSLAIGIKVELEKAREQAQNIV